MKRTHTELKVEAIQETAPAMNISLAWSLAALSEVPIMFFSGYLIKRFGSWTILSIALAATTIRLIIYALFPDPHILMASQLLNSLSFGALHATSIYLINSLLPARRLGLGMALYVSLGNGLSTSLGNAMAGQIVEHLGYKALFLSYSLLPLLAIGVLAIRRNRRIKIS